MALNKIFKIMNGLRWKSIISMYLTEANEPTV